MNQNILTNNNKKFYLLFILFILQTGSAFSQPKFVGNIHSSYDDPNFTAYWNQVTPENAGKWSACERNCDDYDWSNMDQAYAFAKERGLPIKQHTLVWGNQYPSWMDGLSTEEQAAEVEEWIRDFSERYPDCDYVDVVNEPLPGHNPAPFKNALGGDGATGWDWVITSFELAREYFPNAQLLLNDFGIINNTWAAGELAKTANLLIDRGLIDGIGLQCHAFSINDVDTSTMTDVLDILANTGLPIYISELDIGGDEATQYERYKEKFPVLYLHSGVKGITLWGYRKDHMWIPDAWLYNETTGYERQALKWLKSFLIEQESDWIVPGRIEAEDYFGQSGIDTISINDSTLVIDNLNHMDWVSYLMNVLEDEEYDVNIKVTDPVNNSKVYLLVDDVYLDTINVDDTMDTLSTTLFLEKGKHTLKLVLSNSESEDVLMQIDWLDIYGETTYQTLNASSEGNGEIYPNGNVYLATGDSLTFTFDADPGYKPDSIIINGTSYFADPAGYTLYDVTEEHTIVSSFTSCSGIGLSPFYKLNDQEYASGPEVAATEMDTVTLMVAFEEDGNTYWKDIVGERLEESELRIDAIQKSQAGVYGFFHIDTSGCKSYVDFDISVANIQLDVYEAEDYVSQSGIQKEDAEDTGGGQNIGYIENGDWCSYELELEAGIYDFAARAATETGGGSIKVNIGTRVLGTLNISGSNSDGWQDWFTTAPVELDFTESGTQTVKFTFTGGGGYLFNLNWFDLTYNRPSEYTSLDENYSNSFNLQVYPNPAQNNFNISYELEERDIVDIKLMDVNGRMLYALTQKESKAAGVHHLNWNAEALPNGIYLLHFIIDDQVETRKVFITK